MEKRHVALVFASLLLAGCSTPSMKGTPFYTGEYEKREGPDPDRINLIVFYRRNSVSHVFWPLMEFGPKFAAVRPVYSVHDRDTDDPVYNVLWPIGRFDPGNEDYRIFPVYWGDEYFNVVPLYWHEGDPIGGVGHNVLFPLWIWDNQKEGDYLSVFWPLYARHRFPDHQAWRLWPLYGTQLKNGRQYRYVAWPFIHAYSNSVHTGHGAIPLYWHDKTDDRSTFVSLPYSRSMTDRAGATSWDLALPLCYRQWKGDSFYWEVYPALSWGRRDPGKTDNWYALGLGRRMESKDRNAHHVIPLYYYGKDSLARSIYTLPWWSKKYTDGTGWHILFPAYYHSRYAGESAFYSLPWWSKSYSDGTGWHALFPICFRSRTEDSSAFYSLPWLSRKKSDGSGWSTTLPIYFHSYTDQSSLFYSLPWFSEKRADGSDLQASFPFYFRYASADGSIMITPLYARQEHADGALAWHCIIPLVYQDKSFDKHFMTLLGGRWSLGDQHNWLALPLLSGGVKDADSGRNIWLAGLGGQEWAGDDKAHYLIPVYYKSTRNDHFVSLPYATWQKDGQKHRSIPVLLSGWYSKDDASGSLWLAGLAGHRSGFDRNDYNYVAPFYYRAPQKGTFVSLPYAAWRNGDRQNHMVPPLLSGWYSENGVSGSVLAAGLAGYRSGDENAYHYLFPFYYAAPPKGTFLSLPYAAWRTGEKQSRTLPLLLSGWSSEADVSEALLLGGLGYWKTKGQQFEASHVLPFYLWARDDYFYTVPFGKNERMAYYATPLAGRYHGKGGSGSWAFPLYRHRQKISGEINGNYLLLGYYRKNSRRTAHGVFGIYDHYNWKSFEGSGSDRHLAGEGKTRNYLLFVGHHRERWTYESEAQKVTRYSKNQYVFPVWQRNVKDDVAAGKRLEDSSLLGLLYDTLHEQEAGKEQHDYLRRRILWRLWHYEKLNGDVSVDAFPGITVDSYKNGYHKTSFLWRLFRYENDPETGRKKLDLLFIPFRR